MQQKWRHETRSRENDNIIDVKAIWGVIKMAEKESESMSAITWSLIKKAKEWGIDTDKVVYSVCIGDIIEIIAESSVVLDLIPGAITKEKLEELIDIGAKGSENIDWYTAIETAIIDKVMTA